ncbi:probable NADH dehydrogenase [ubiquinone] 1 alpha subcomplex subunit 12 [Frankliniella occidentalis]|uniref:NADH dehydrogenase [ubiquinone] 1 alpha subcomplex subunit 12 n=1 Tax=Frankliniella occidentalis TaxID=133901 RepID=A0A6J1S555_FRAOC|nr:probable NADH dehydrogenase [ubiquinone] 1 alpha subcomplex subunit 12 [Frankliniella occidentalis]
MAGNVVRPGSLADKFQRLKRIVDQSGGWKGFLLRAARIDEVKEGKLVGVDKFGNKYYENPMYFLGRNRWVEYSERYGYDYDGSQIPAEWYGWMHYKTDRLPSEDPTRPKYKWIKDHEENPSGTEKAYVPYSTTRPKIEAWKPPKA